jgi:hypothetical protein
MRSLERGICNEINASGFKPFSNGVGPSDQAAAIFTAEFYGTRIKHLSSYKPYQIAAIRLHTRTTSSSLTAHVVRLQSLVFKDYDVVQYGY